MLRESDILKSGVKLKAFKINGDDPDVKRAIAETIKQQESILKLKEIDPKTLELIINS